MIHNVFKRARIYLERFKLVVLLQFVLLCSAMVLGGYVIVDRDITTANHVIASVSHRSMTMPFSQLALQAKAIHIYDVKNKRVLYAHNADDIFSLASLTKVATALTVSRILPENTPIRLNGNDIAIQGDSGLRAGETWNSGTLRDLVLVASSNDGAYSMAAAAGKRLRSTQERDDAVEAFVDAMNQTVRDIGLTDTTFYNPSGLDINQHQSGGYGSAADVSELMAYVLENEPSLLEATRHSAIAVSSQSNRMLDATNTNPSVGKIPGILASKTGYTMLSGGNVVIAYDPFPGRPIIITVLGSTYGGRFEDVEKLTHATLEYIRKER